MSENMDPSLLTGQLTVTAGRISPEHLAESIRERDGQRIGDKLVAHDLISREELERLLARRDSSQASLEETVLGELAVRNAFVTREQLEECLAEQEDSRNTTGTPPRLGEILVARGLISQPDVEALLHRQTCLLQTIVSEDSTSERDGDREDSTSDVSEEVPSNLRPVASVGDDSGEPQEGVVAEDDSATAKPKRGIMGLLFPDECKPVTCPACNSSANSPLATVCGGCGGPLRSRAGAQKLTPWLLRAAFVVLAGVTGVFSLHAGPYVIAAVMFIILGATMLRSYRPSQRFFLCFSVILLAGVYVASHVLGLTKDQVAEVARNAIVWDASWAGASALLAVLALALIGPLAVPKVRGLGGVLLLFAALLAVGWLAGGWATGRPFPLWAAISLGGVALILAVLMISLMFVDGFRIKTRRPGVIVEATRPFAMPARPEKQPRNLSELPALARPVYLAFDGIVWSGQMSGYYMLSSIIRFANGVAYWAQLIVDLLLRSLVRAWRRLLELTKALGKVIAGMVAFVALAVYRLALVVVFPLAAIAVSAVVGIALASAAVTYITIGGLANLASAGIYAAMMYLICVIVVGLLARCHPSHVVVKEAFQAFSLHLPNFLMLILGTSIVLSVFRWATGIGPYRFGFLSIALIVLMVGLFAAILYKAKKSTKGATLSIATAELQAASSPPQEAETTIPQEDDERDLTGSSA